MKKSLFICFVVLFNYVFSLEPIIVLFGPPGSGKGTFGDFAHEKGYHHLSAGDLVRDEINQGTSMGMQMKEIVARGDYIDPDLMFQMIKQKVVSLIPDERGLIIDGYVRSEDELQRITTLLHELKIEERALVLLFDVEDALCKERMQSRLVCNSCHHVYNAADKHYFQGQTCSHCELDVLRVRINDTDEVIAKRIKKYREDIEPVFQHAKQVFPSLIFYPDQDKSTCLAFYEGFLKEVKDFQGNSKEFVSGYVKKIIEKSGICQNQRLGFDAKKS